MSFRNFSGAVELAQLLSADFTVINYDRRGRGDSGDIKPYAVEREIEDLAALVQAVGGWAYVYGMSSGAADDRSGAIKYFITKIMGAPAFIVWIMRLLPFWKKLKAVAHTLPYDMTIMSDFSLPQKIAESVRVLAPVLREFLK